MNGRPDSAAGLPQLKRSDGFAYREALPVEESGAPVLLLHGFPESSRMWEPLMTELASHGRRSLAPDLYCLGDSDDPGPATFERNLEAVGAFHTECDLEEVELIVHDWGGFVGLAWAVENPELVASLVIADAGFFSDGRWHGMAQALRGEQGEEIIEQLDRDGFAALLRADGAPFTDEQVDAYWQPFADGRGREATLEFYRSMDFSKLVPYEDGLAELDVPTLLLWGAEDKFAPLSGAKRFQREIPEAELVAIDDAGHFVFDEEAGRCCDAVIEHLGGG
ncbi:alpha/beta hydrolase [soil metagenome]